MGNAIEQLYVQMLVLRCQTGDNGAFSELVERYSPRLRYFLRQMLGSDRAEDALQDVWLDAFRGMTSLSAPAAFTTWIYRIASARAHRELRLNYRATPESLNEQMADLTTEDEDFSTEDIKRVHEELAALPFSQREVLTLRYLEGMSYEELAGVIGCALGTIRSRIHYAKQALRKQWEGTS